MKQFLLVDYGSSDLIEAESWKDARICAAENLYDGYHDSNDTKTSWVDAYLGELDEQGDIIEETQEMITVTIHPDPPECWKGEEHEWSSPFDIVGGCKENPGVYGCGGGVKITMVCLKCGCRKTGNTWDQRTDTGEQGLHSTEYEEECYSDILQNEAEKVAAEAKELATKVDLGVEFKDVEFDWDRFPLLQGAFLDHAQETAKENFEDVMEVRLEEADPVL